MTTALSAVVGFASAATASLVFTPIAIAVANRLDFYDRPRGYRKHRAPTPFLGGAAVIASFIVASVVVGGLTERSLVIVGCASGLCLLGTVDDWIAVAPKWRLLAETLAAVTLVAAGLGWHTSAGSWLDLALTIVWVVGMVNAFNLMDNLDGACGTVGCVSACGIGALATVHQEAILAGLAFGLAGACLAFLRFNLSAPARIFLGDGGSMPIGFLVAALAMLTTRKFDGGGASPLTAALLAGLPILDTALVSISRKRRGVTLLTGGRDHLTHRLLLAVDSPRAVAATLAFVQALLCALAIVGDRLGNPALVGCAVGAASIGALTIVWLDTARWRPPGIAFGPRRLVARPVSEPTVSVDSG
jgi:UDP-GlcNAc:undecaprenyl-phosphate/decaprenyl-phosphate GlcNAc-1-phosphate transferase